MDTQDFLSFESCRSSAVDYIEEISRESPRKMQDEQEAASEAPNQRRNGDAGNHSFMERGGRRAREPLMVKVAMSGAQAKSSRRESEASGEESGEVKSPKRKVIRVESEETQDYVREKPRTWK